MDSEMVVSYSWGSTAGFRMVEYDMERFFQHIAVCTHNYVHTGKVSYYTSYFS